MIDWFGRPHRRASERFAARQEYAIAGGRSVQSVYSRAAGYEDVNDAERLSQDPAFWLIWSEKV